MTLLNWATSRRSFLVLSSLLILYNEFFVYLATKTLLWKDVQCNTTENCTRILLVADPQLIGETFDMNAYNGLAIFDSDRFLYSSFRFAFGHSYPDVVGFLGDLMDEGSVANDEQYLRYTKRFRNIYNVDDTASNKMFYIPGDNDIGGEYMDVITTAKVQRFRRTFAVRPFLDVANRTRLINVNLLTHSTPNVTQATTPAHLNRVILSHISLLSYPGFYSDRITNSIRPHVVFSAHLHLARTLSYPPMHFTIIADNAVRSYDLHESPTAPPHGDRKYLEIAVPTCSYRMGVPHIGFGLAIIENQQLRYTVLWLPNRFTLLFSYVIWIAVAMIIFLLRSVCCRSCIISRQPKHILATYKRVKYNKLIGQ